MIVGIGTDIVELARIDRLLQQRGDQFTERISRPGEVSERAGAAQVQHLGGLFAAKEAVLKALGTGWAQGLTLRQVEIVKNDAGGPGVALHDAARERAAELGITQIHLSITHERQYAFATAVAEAFPTPDANR